LIKAIRLTDSEYRGFTPVIAMTSFASPEDEARALAAGFNAFIAKPFDSQSVVAAVAELLNSQTMLGNIQEVRDRRFAARRLVSAIRQIAPRRSHQYENKEFCAQLHS
jgi:CheY-like chemotaxis protein